MKSDKPIWFAIVFSTFIYAVIAYSVAGTPEGTLAAAVKQQIPTLLYALALASFVAGLLLPGRLRAPARMKMIVALALFESCAVYGLLAAFLTRDWRLFVPPWIIGLIGMWRVYPSDEPALTV